MCKDLQQLGLQEVETVGEVKKKSLEKRFSDYLNDMLIIEMFITDAIDNCDKPILRGDKKEALLEIKEMLQLAKRKL